jgi:phosphoglycolate phosphatase
MIKTNRAIPKDKLKLLIFDLDGTLVDSRKDLANSINAMLENYHRPHLADDVIATYIGDGAPTLVRRSLGFKDDHDLQPKEEEFIEDALVYFLEYYREHKLDFTYVYDGVKVALSSLAAKGLAMSVLSNKPVNPSRAIVNHLGLGRFFKYVYGGNSFETKKPDPLGIHTLLREHGVSAEQAVIIGDSSVDMQTGRNANVWTCACTYGLSPETLKKCPGDVSVDAPSDWVEVFG